jgi:hypothetical protein
MRLFWNANDVFGFARVDWRRMRERALVTTMSRHVKRLMAAERVKPVMLPNASRPMRTSRR